MSDKKDDLRDLKALRDLFDRVGSPSAPLMHKVPNQNVRPHWMSFSVSGEAGQTLSVDGLIGPRTYNALVNWQNRR